MKEEAPAALEGVFVPVVTPFRDDLAPDPDRFVRHCRWLLAQHCGLAVFGTNSEANSLSVGERMALLDTLLEKGLPASRMMPGTGCSSLTDTVALTSHALSAGVGGVLMLPPFYYKGVSDEGLFRHFSEVVERVGDTRLRVYLYHIPPIAQVAITLPLIERLLKRYPEQIAGVKDSSGEWSNTAAMLERFPGFRVFVGSESFLLQNMRSGGVGCISAIANVNPGAIHNLYVNWRTPDADRLQTELNAVRAVLSRYPMIAALKATIAGFAGDPSWALPRPPLLRLDDAERESLIAELRDVGFAMPAVPERAAA